MKKQIGVALCAFVITAAMVLCLLPVPTRATTVDSGFCGDDVLWMLDDTGTLTIMGSGAMYDYPSLDAPWQAHSETIQTVVVEDGVTSVGQYAFAYCKNLVSVQLGSHVIRIGDEAFCFCESLTQIEIPDQVISLGYDAFFGCSCLTTVKLSASLQEIGPQAFTYCERLENIMIPDGVTTIGPRAFQFCQRLTSVAIPDSVTSIGEMAFSSCKNLESVTLPNGITTIAPGLFIECEKLTSIVIPDQITDIHWNAFNFCTNLEIVMLPAGLQSIHESAFVGCEKLWHVLYKGTEEMWNSIAIDYGNTCLTGSAFHYNYDGSWLPDVENQICLECCRIGNHSISQGERVDPTCTDNGYERGICSYCRENVEKILPATGHLYHNSVPGHEIPVKDGDQCKNCGYVFTLPQGDIPGGLMDKYVNSYTDWIMEKVTQGMAQELSLSNVCDQLIVGICIVVVGSIAAVVLIWRKRR